MARPEGLTDEEIKAAQSKLQKLCLEYDINAFEIKHTGHDSKKWQALVLRMCGLNVVDPKWGPKENEGTYDIGNHAYALLDFWDIDSKTGKKVTKEDIYRAVVEAQNVKPKDMPQGRKTKPRNTVKKALSAVMERRQKPSED